MNGATAVPLVSTMSPPNMAMTMNTGSSQYFLRSSKNAVNSRRKDTIARSELVHEAVGRRAWRLSRFPVTFALRLEAKPQRVFAAEPHEPADRRDAAIVHDPQHEGAHDRKQDEAKLGPQPVERGEQARAVKRDNRKHDGCCQPIRPARTALVERQGRNQRRKAGKDVAEPAIRRGLHDVLSAVKLVGAKVLVVHAVCSPCRYAAHAGNPIFRMRLQHTVPVPREAREVRSGTPREHAAILRYHLTTADAGQSSRRCPSCVSRPRSTLGLGSWPHAGATACLNRRIATTREAFTWLSHKCRVPVTRRGQLSRK